MRKSIIFVLVIIIIVAMTGCGSKEEKTSEPAHVTVQNTDSEAVLFAKDANSFPVDIMFINVSGVDIGMLSIIDPGTHEQMNVAGLEDQTSMNIGANWPKEEAILNWALYNMQGELCIEGSSDLTGITESATIVLGGDGDVTEIDVQVN